MKLIVKLILIVFVTSLAGCKMVYFDQPQPVDGKLLNSFPKQFRGTWKTDLSTLTIDKSSITQFGFETVKIPISSLDTSSVFIKKGDYIYKFEGDHLEYKGNFTINGDTLVVKKLSSLEEHGLSQNIILKKVSKYFILNIREDNGMWQIVQLEKVTNGDILFKILNNDKLVEVIGKENLSELTSPSLNLDSEDSRDYYYSSNLLKADIIKLIDSNAFSDTLINLSDNHQWLSPLFMDKEK